MTRAMRTGCSSTSAALAAASGSESDAGEHRVLAAGEEAEHAAGVLRHPAGLPRISPSTTTVVSAASTSSPGCARSRGLLDGEPEHVVAGGLAGSGDSSSPPARTVKRSAEPLQQLAPPRGARGEDQGRQVFQG